MLLSSGFDRGCLIRLLGGGSWVSGGLIGRFRSRRKWSVIAWKEPSSGKVAFFVMVGHPFGLVISGVGGLQLQPPFSRDHRRPSQTVHRRGLELLRQQVRVRAGGHGDRGVRPVGGQELDFDQ